MTATRITTEAELNEYRSKVARGEKHAARQRERSEWFDPDTIGDRLLNAPQRAPAGEGKPIPAEVTAESARTLRATLAGRPDPATRTAGDDIEACWRITDYTAESFYERWLELRWFDLLTGADDRLRKPADDAAAAFTMGTAPGLPAIVATSRPSQPWVMHSPDDFETACAAIEGDIHCDLQISGPTVIDRKRYAKCVDWFQSITAPKTSPPGCDERTSEVLRQDREGYNRDLIVESFTTLPVARGDLIVLVRVCRWCLGAYLSQNGVRSAECIVEELHSDGFGSLLVWGEPPEPVEEPVYESDFEDDEREDYDE
jgi:hypothetical protein